MAARIILDRNDSRHIAIPSPTRKFKVTSPSTRSPTYHLVYDLTSHKPTVDHPSFQFTPLNDNRNATEPFTQVNHSQTSHNHFYSPSTSPRTERSKQSRTKSWDGFVDHLLHSRDFTYSYRTNNNREPTTDTNYESTAPTYTNNGYSDTAKITSSRSSKSEQAIRPKGFLNSCTYNNPSLIDNLGDSRRGTRDEACANDAKSNVINTSMIETTNISSTLQNTHRQLAQHKQRSLKTEINYKNPYPLNVIQSDKSGWDGRGLEYSLFNGGGDDTTSDPATCVPDTVSILNDFNSNDENNETDKSAHHNAEYPSNKPGSECKKNSEHFLGAMARKQAVFKTDGDCVRLFIVGSGDRMDSSVVGRYNPPIKCSSETLPIVCPLFLSASPAKDANSGRLSSPAKCSSKTKPKTRGNDRKTSSKFRSLFNKTSANHDSGNPTPKAPTTRKPINRWENVEFQTPHAHSPKNITCYEVTRLTKEATEGNSNKLDNRPLRNHDLPLRPTNASEKKGGLKEVENKTAGPEIKTPRGDKDCPGSKFPVHGGNLNSSLLMESSDGDRPAKFYDFSQQFNVNISGLKVDDFSDKRVGGISDKRVGGISDKRVGGISDIRVGGISDKRVGGISDKRVGGISDMRVGGISGSRLDERQIVDMSKYIIQPSDVHSQQHNLRQYLERLSRGDEQETRRDTDKSNSWKFNDKLGSNGFSQVFDVGDHDAPAMKHVNVKDGCCHQQGLSLAASCPGLLAQTPASGGSLNNILKQNHYDENCESASLDEYISAIFIDSTNRSRSETSPFSRRRCCTQRTSANDQTTGLNSPSENASATKKSHCSREFQNVGPINATLSNSEVTSETKISQKHNLLNLGSGCEHGDWVKINGLLKNTQDLSESCVPLLLKDTSSLILSVVPTTLNDTHTFSSTSVERSEVAEGGTIQLVDHSYRKAGKTTPSWILKTANNQETETIAEFLQLNNSLQANSTLITRTQSGDPSNESGPSKHNVPRLKLAPHKESPRARFERARAARTSAVTGNQRLSRGGLKRTDPGLETVTFGYSSGDKCDSRDVSSTVKSPKLLLRSVSLPSDTETNESGLRCNQDKLRHNDKRSLSYLRFDSEDKPRSYGTVPRVRQTYKPNEIDETGPLVPSQRTADSCYLPAKWANQTKPSVDKDINARTFPPVVSGSSASINIYKIPAPVCEELDYSFTEQNNWNSRVFVPEKVKVGEAAVSVDSEGCGNHKLVPVSPHKDHRECTLAGEGECVEKDVINCCGCGESCGQQQQQSAWLSASHQCQQHDSTRASLTADRESTRDYISDRTLSSQVIPYDNNGNISSLFLQDSPSCGNHLDFGNVQYSNKHKDDLSYILDLKKYPIQNGFSTDFHKSKCKKNVTNNKSYINIPLFNQAGDCSQYHGSQCTDHYKDSIKQKQSTDLSTSVDGLAYESNKQCCESRKCRHLRNQREERNSCDIKAINSCNRDCFDHINQSSTVNNAVCENSTTYNETLFNTTAAAQENCVTQVLPKKNEPTTNSLNKSICSTPVFRSVKTRMLASRGLRIYESRDDLMVNPCKSPYFTPTTTSHFQWEGTTYLILPTVVESLSTTTASLNKHNITNNNSELLAQRSLSDSGVSLRPTASLTDDDFDNYSTTCKNSEENNNEETMSTRNRKINFNQRSMSVDVLCPENELNRSSSVTLSDLSNYGEDNRSGRRGYVEWKTCSEWLQKSDPTIIDGTDSRGYVKWDTVWPANAPWIVARKDDDHVYDEVGGSKENVTNNENACDSLLQENSFTPVTIETPPAVPERTYINRLKNCSGDGNSHSSGSKMTCSSPSSVHKHRPPHHSHAYYNQDSSCKKHHHHHHHHHHHQHRQNSTSEKTSLPSSPALITSSPTSSPVSSNHHDNTPPRSPPNPPHHHLTQPPPNPAHHHLTQPPPNPAHHHLTQPPPNPAHHHLTQPQQVHKDEHQNYAKVHKDGHQNYAKVHKLRGYKFSNVITVSNNLPRPNPNRSAIYSENYWHLAPVTSPDHVTTWHSGDVLNFIDGLHGSMSPKRRENIYDLLNNKQTRVKFSESLEIESRLLSKGLISATIAKKVAPEQLKVQESGAREPIRPRLIKRKGALAPVSSTYV